VREGEGCGFVRFGGNGLEVEGNRREKGIFSPVKLVKSHFFV
jgi:hypothetical protein